ncbi:MAG: DUF1015 domain-containing protein, partial [Candidatus Cloacimonetes bacterium]|nr:DUF1015 domain-containing protein [Candidatus Cloacimonadota bacterium]
MAKIKPFRGLRPLPEKVKVIASPPYDVLNSREARIMAQGNPDSFLHVVKPEIDLSPDIDLYDHSVYQKGKENLERLIKQRYLVQDVTDCYYLYRQIMKDFDQIGLVAAVSIEDYENDIIKKHEHTRADKEADRIRHVDTLNANSGLVFLTYKARSDLKELAAEIMDNDPIYDFTADDGVKHIFWKIDSEYYIEKITTIFSQIDYLYVADGHHRSASGTRVGQMRRAANPHHTGEEEYNYFMAAIFPHDQLHILDYNRVVKDLNGLNPAEFLEKVAEKFLIAEYSSELPYHPTESHQFGMYLQGTWYRLTAKPGTFSPSDPVLSLDVSILQNNLLSPVLDIQDPRNDKRIDFVGG